MRSTMKARIATGNRENALCDVCRGSGQDPRVPFRRASNGEVVYLVRACPGCEGRGIPTSESDRDLTLV